MALPREGEASTFSSTNIGKETNRRLREITEKLCCILDKTGGGSTSGTDYEFTNFQWFCDKVSQESVSRTDLYTNGVFTSHIWQDINGNVIPTPIVGNLSVGACAFQYDSEVVCLVPDGSPVGTPPVSGFVVFDTTSPTPIPSYFIGSTDVTLTHTQVPCAGSSDWELLEVELVDDVANDGTGAIIPYSELYNVSSTGIRTLIATVDEKGANYTLVGTRRNRNEIGVLSKTATNQVVLNGSSWSPLETMTQFSYAVINVANTLTPPTFTGSDNITVPLYAGEYSEYSVITGTEKFKVLNVTISANPGDIVKVVYSQITI